MINNLSRREFIFGALCLGVAPAVIWPLDQRPAPRIYKLAQWRSYKKLKGLERAFEFLESPSNASKAPGRYALEGDRLYATIVEDKTRAIETAQFEEHRKYIDVHYLIRGQELIGSANPSSMKVAKPYSPEVEAALYERPAKYKRLLLKPGEFTVFFPGQAHMPGCYVDKSEGIRKVVVKILA
jgi:YhcH/YjgK/YiaL family protein